MTAHHPRRRGDRWPMGPIRVDRVITDPDFIGEVSRKLMDAGIIRIPDVDRPRLRLDGENGEASS